MSDSASNGWIRTNTHAIQLLFAVEDFLEKPWSLKRFRAMKKKTKAFRDQLPPREIRRVAMDEHFKEVQKSNNAGLYRTSGSSHDI